MHIPNHIDSAILHPAEHTRKEPRALTSLIKHWGNSASITLLDPSCTIFRVAEIDGFIGYRLKAGRAVVFGDPVCAPEHKQQLALAFDAHCKKEKLHYIYVTVSQDFSTWAMKNTCNVLFEIGYELIMDPQLDPKLGSIGRVVRRKVNHAQRASVLVKEYDLVDTSLQSVLKNFEIEWLKSRKGPQLFFAHVDLFEDTLGRRWFYAEQNGQIVGLLLLNKLESRQGWLLHVVMVKSDAPVGTSELLITTAIEALRAEGCKSFSFGVSKANELGQVIGLNKFTIWSARKLFKFAEKLFSLDGRRKYWEKYQPKPEPTFVLFSRANMGARDLVALSQAINVSI